VSGLHKFRIVLAKEDFKFSAAHFTLFGDRPAELLHGHNYRVRVELQGTELDAEGLLADLERCKGAVRALCRRLDSRTLLPAAGERLICVRRGESVEARLGDRCYSFPAADVVLLPLANTSIELLARMFWLDLAPGLRDSRVDSFAVAVEESAGQSCWYEDRLTPTSPAHAPSS
jgi:6-pyruvoyltetrahydropterin/6-carboxytetrahydropterin synthase